MRLTLQFTMITAILAGSPNLYGQQKGETIPSSGTQPAINDPALGSTLRFTEIFNSTFDSPDVLKREAGKWRRESMAKSNNSGQHRQAPGRRHAAWYDRYQDQTAFFRDGVLGQRGICLLYTSDAADE